MKKNRFLVLGLCAGLFLAAGCGQPVGTESSVSETSVVESENAAEAEAILSSDQEIPEKLSALSQINGDVYAWLDIPGTNISFPVLQNAQDTGFYLIHNEAGQSDEAGSIYTEYVNSKDFTDNNTVIYGRNVDSRFGRLHQYRDRDFFDSNHTIEIYLPDKTLTYQIFAAYTSSSHASSSPSPALFCPSSSCPADTPAVPTKAPSDLRTTAQIPYSQKRY